jgi:hypothetical protein
VNIDDCWAESERNAEGKFEPNHTTFPSGIKALADYMHGRGLKLCIYTSAGTRTCTLNHARRARPTLTTSTGSSRKAGLAFSNFGTPVTVQAPPPNQITESTTRTNAASRSGSKR